MARGVLELGRDRAHPADRHLPFAGLVADEVIKKTAVLHERWIVRVGEDADLRIRQDQAAHQIVLQVTLDRVPEWFLCQTAPCFL